MSFMDSPGNREVVPKILQPSEDLAEFIETGEGSVAVSHNTWLHAVLTYQPTVAGQPYT